MACVRIRACHSAFYPIDGRSAHSEISWLDRGGGQSAPVSRVRRPGAVDAQRRRTDLFIGAVCAGTDTGPDTVRLAGPARWRQRLETAAAWRRRYDAAGHPADPFLARDHRSVGRPRCMGNRRRTAPLDRRPDPVAHHILAERQQECRRRFAAPGVLRTPEERGNATHGIIADRRTYLPWGYALPREQNSLAALATDPGLNAWHRMQLVSTHETPAFGPTLFVARAKAERENDPDLLSDWLTPEEKRAFLHDAELVQALLTAEPRLLRA